MISIILFSHAKLYHIPYTNRQGRAAKKYSYLRQHSRDAVEKGPFYQRVLHVEADK
jgi:hypothetical protein